VKLADPLVIAGIAMMVSGWTILTIWVYTAMNRD
jgi:hypothetical protein